METEKKLIMMAVGRGDRPIKDEKETEEIRSVMITGNYPASINNCEVVGISGGCGENCPVHNIGQCPIIEECIDNGMCTREEAIEIGYELEPVKEIEKCQSQLNR